MAPTKEQIRKFNSEIRQLQRQASGLTPETRRAVQAIVDTHRKAINDIVLHSAGVGEQANIILPQRVGSVTNQVRDQVNMMIDEIRQAVVGAQKTAWETGLLAANKVASTAGLTASVFGVSNELAVIASNYTAGLITSIGPEFLPKINGIIQRAALGGMTPFEAMKQIDTVIGASAKEGVSYAAERIVRTEVQRVYSIAFDTYQQQFMERLGSDAGKKLKKTWVSGPDRPGRRPEHQAMDGETVGVNEKFSNGLRFPRDPNGPADETINCGCGWEVEPDSIEEALDASIVSKLGL